MEATIEVVAAAVAVLLALIAVAYYVLVLRKNKVRRGTFALMGVSNAGKTTLFYKLHYGRFVPCQTSMKENQATFALASEVNDKRALSKPVLVIDIPGHEKLRFLFLSWEQQLGGIVFVVDAAAFSRNFRQVAEYLYDVLSNEHVVQGRVPVLVACNKSDLPDAQPAHRVQSTLEAEFNQLRTTRSAAPARQSDDQADQSSANSFLGYETKKFAFGDIENEVTFVESSVDAVHSVEEWIRSVYPL